MKRACLLFSCIMICILLAGCNVGEYKVVDLYFDEKDNQHFMVFGEVGPSGGEGRVENKDSSSEANDLQGNESISKAIDDMQEEGADYNPESIVGISLKRGWTSSDHSILKGKDVSVQEDSTLFSINLVQDKRVIITYDMELDSGEYELVYISPDGTEQVLQDGQTVQAVDKILFTQGKNEIAVLSGDAIFKEINITITGIEVSDF